MASVHDRLVNQRFKYDNRWNLLIHTLKDGTSIKYTYDTEGNVLSKNSIKYEYDNNGNLKKVISNIQTIEQKQ